MKRILSWFCLMGLLTSMMAVTVTGESDIIYETVESDHVTEGLTYEYKEIFTEDGWVDLHVLIWDLAAEDLTLEVLRSTDDYGFRNTVADFVSSYLEANEGQVVGAVNGSFFNMGGEKSEPIGTQYNEDYEYAVHNYNISSQGAASLIKTIDDQFMMDFFGITMTFKNSDDRALYLSGINKFKDTNNPVLYNQAFALDTEKLDSSQDIYKLIVQNDMVTQIVEPGLIAAIPEDGYIITIPEADAPFHLSFYQPGTVVSLDIDSTVDTSNIDFAISGGGKILEAGEVVETGMIIEPTKRHPRTALGLAEDGSKMVAMVVDGRGASIGATHQELADFLLAYNVTDAIHMDGGGSSTLMSRELGREDLTTFNTPSSGYQRSIVNGLAFVSTAVTGPVETVEIIPSTEVVFMNNPITLELIGYDANYNPVPVDIGKVFWSVGGELTGEFGNNTFTPTNAAEGTLNCYYNGIQAEKTIRSLDSPIDLTVSPRVMYLDFNEQGTFTVSGMDNSGYEGAINTKDMIYTVEDKAIGAFIQGEFYSGTKAGMTKVKMQMGNRWTTAYVVVGTETQVLDSFETASYDQRTYPETVIGMASVDTEVFYDTDMSYRFDYELASSPDPQAVYMMMNDYMITDKSDSISLQLLGNNSGHMFKGRVVDAKGKVETLTFVHEIDFEGWKKVTAELPDDLVYPIELERLYLVALQSYGEFKGIINIDELSVMSQIKAEDLSFDDEGFIDDVLKVDIPPQSGTEIAVFGATAFRNRLLDNLLLTKVYETMNTSDYSIFGGYTDIKEEKVQVPHISWDNAFEAVSIDGVKVINLATGEGGLRATDSSQYESLDQTLKTTSENIIILVGSKNPLTTFKDRREGELLHNILKEHFEQTGKTIVYIHAGGYKTDVTIKDGVRYFDLSGLWYRVEDRYVDLNKMFYSLRFYVDQGELQYMFQPMFPAVEF